MGGDIRKLPGPREILLASRELPGLGALLDCLHPIVEVRLLEGDADPIPAITRALAHGSLEVLHLLGNGAPGEISITAAPPLDAEAARSLRPAASRRLEVNIWASGVAAGGRGRHFLQVLAESTRARVLASDGDVGGPDSGASWDLAITARPRGSLPFARPARDALRLPHASAHRIKPLRTR